MAAISEGSVPIPGCQLYTREVGQGQPIVILHGGPDFDHRYLLPDMDRLSDAFRLIYYDQRGRGRSGLGVEPADVTMQSDVRDLDEVRQHFGLKSTAILGHSWGGLLAMEYAIQHANRVSHLILMNTAPASRDDYLLFRQERRDRSGADVDELQALSAGAAYQEGDPDAVAGYYRVHFKAALSRPEYLDRVIDSLRASFTKEGILKGREVEDGLMQETWLSREYDLLPLLESLNIPTLVIHGERDFIPLACAVHIAHAIPGARYVPIRDCGHFAFLEQPDEVRRVLQGFYDDTRGSLDARSG